MKLHEILQDQTIAATQFDFTGTCPDKEGNNYTATIFNTAYFISEVLHKYFNREIFILDTEHAYNEFCSIFNLWEANRGLMFARMAYAYSLGYNPIENYSSVEVMDRTDRTDYNSDQERTYNNDLVERTYNNDKIERTHTADKIERTYTNDSVERSYTNFNTEHTHTNDKETTTYTNLVDQHDHDKYGVNSSGAVHVSKDTDTRNGVSELERTGSDKDTITGSYADTHSGGYDDTHTGGYDDTHTGGYEDEHTGGYTDDHSGYDSTDIDYTLTKSGNIGVLTASEMLAREFAGLDQNLADRAIRDFLQENTFYSGEVDLSDY